MSLNFYTKTDKFFYEDTHRKLPRKIAKIDEKNKNSVQKREKISIF